MPNNPISTEKIKETATMAGLVLSDAELKSYAKDMANILELVEQMEEVDTHSTNAMAHPLELDQTLGQDTVETMTKDDRAYHHTQIAKNAPVFKDGYFLVSQVIDNKRDT